MDSGLKIYKVGGYVRDLYMGSDPSDLDLVVVLDNIDQSVDDGWNVLIDYLNESGFQIFSSKKEYFTVKAKFPKKCFELKHFDFKDLKDLVVDFVLSRKEIGYIPNTRKPICKLGTLLDDLERRDFTINALALDSKGNLIDPFNGLKDIEDKIIRTIKDPVQSFEEDPLRILRCLRFAVVKRFKIEEKTWEAIFQINAVQRLMTTVSGNRILGELVKMMRHDTVASLRLLAQVDQRDPKFTEFVFGKEIWLLPTMKKR